LGAAVSFGGWGLVGSTASFAGLVSAPPLISGITVGTIAALACYGASQIIRKEPPKLNVRELKPSGSREPLKLRKEDIPEVLKELKKDLPVVKREDIMAPRAPLGLLERPQVGLTPHIMPHKPEDIEKAKELAKRGGIAKEGDMIEDVQGIGHAGDLWIGRKMGQKWIEKKIIEVEGLMKNGRYDTGHIIKQSMEIIMKNMGDEVYFAFVHGRPPPANKSLIDFMTKIGAEQVPGTNGMLWRFPKFSEETARRYFECLTGMKGGDIRTMLESVNKMLRGEIDVFSPFMRGFWETSKRLYLLKSFLEALMKNASGG